MIDKDSTSFLTAIPSRALLRFALIKKKNLFGFVFYTEKQKGKQKECGF